MNESSLLPDDEPDSMPSERTMRREGEEPILGRIDQYALLRKLGGGGFGVVYLARDSASGVEVALKTLHPLLKHSAEEMDLLREKFRLVHVLTHPNIAKALMLHPCREIDVWDETARRELKLSPGDSMMVMDYAPGATLSKWRRKFPGDIVPFDLAVEVGRQVAAALDYAHSERIIHRDVKPGNIMVETVMPPPAASQVAGPTSQVRPATCDLGRATRIRVRILDFGLAAEIRSSMSRVSTEAGDTSGTRPYMAPEQWMGRKQDGRTDQYALACVLYELLSGAPPFAGVFETGDPIIMRTAVVTDPPEEIEGLSPAAGEALMRALSKAPKDRFPTCTEFVEHCLARQSPSKPEVSPAPSRSARHMLSDELLHIQGKREAEERKAREEAERRTRVKTERNRPAGALLHVTAAGVTFNLRWIPANGSRPAFWMGETPVTQALWTAVMGSNPSQFKGDDHSIGSAFTRLISSMMVVDSFSGMGAGPDQRPVEEVSWYDCQEFLAKLNALDEVRRSGFVFRLPSSDEWEHACRAGSTGDYCRLADGTEIMKKSLGRVAWFDENSGGTTHPVGQKEPNAWGLYDMHGNVWEWTSTAFGEERVFRGGSWFNSARFCESSGRYRGSPSYRFTGLGFRLCASGRAD